MATIEKKVDIPENHRLLLDLTVPADIPPGAAEVRVTIIPAKQNLHPRKAFAGLAGSLKNSNAFGRDAVELQREMRDEW